jgi:ribokinase
MGGGSNERGKQSIGTRLDRFRTMILPDFFVDRIVKIPSYSDFLREIELKQEYGGGSVHGVGQIEIRGGNASNVAYALGRIGVRVDLVAIADSSSRDFLTHSFSALPNVSVNTVVGRSGYTVSLEFTHGGRLVNIMLSDVGDVAAFGPDRIPASCWARIADVDLVGVFNWAANRKGTELAEQIFSEASRNSAKTYFAPADLSSRREEIPRMLNSLRGIFDILSINDNEARIIAKVLPINNLPKGYRPDDIMKTSELLSAAIGTTVDLHSHLGSSTSSEGMSYYAPSFDVERRICTGAGDVWDAANITAHLLQFKPEVRIKFANAAAALYISSRSAESPSYENIVSKLGTNW